MEPIPSSSRQVQSNPESSQDYFKGTLFFIDTRTKTLKPVVSSFPKFKTVEEGVLNLLKVYIQYTPPDTFIHPVSINLDPRSAFLLENGQCVVDFTMDASTTVNLGSQEEMVMVYAIVNTIALNFSEIQSVKILVNGREPDHLLFHMDPYAYYEPNLKP